MMCLYVVRIGLSQGAMVELYELGAKPVRDTINLI